MADKLVAVASVRIIIQQCLSARLQVQPAQDDHPAENVEVGRGIVVYVCFLKGANIDMVPKVVKSVLNVKLCESKEANVSVLDLPGDVLIVPQATLGGKLKGKNIQYHSNVSKEEGLLLYQEFVTLCEKMMSDAIVSRCTKTQDVSKVEHGTYGNRQVLNIETNGPYTHLLDF